MTTEAKRKKLHDFIDTADDQQIIAFYNKLEDYFAGKSDVARSLLKMNKLEIMKQASNDPLFLADMKEVMDDFAVIK